MVTRGPRVASASLLDEAPFGCASLRGGFAALLALAAALAVACAGPPPISRLAFVTRVPGVVEPEILARGVRGEFCFAEDLVRVSLRPPWRARLADPGRAVEDALSRVPGANLLTHVEVWTRVEQYLLFQRICSVVVGDAGRVE
jgi:hypothetical protein